MPQALGHIARFAFAPLVFFGVAAWLMWDAHRAVAAWGISDPLLRFVAPAGSAVACTLAAQRVAGWVSGCGNPRSGGE